MMLNLPQNGCVLGLSVDDLLLMSTKSCHLYSIMGIAILGSIEGDGSDVGGITGEVYGVA